MTAKIQCSAKGCAASTTTASAEQATLSACGASTARTRCVRQLGVKTLFRAQTSRPAGFALSAVTALMSASGSCLTGHASTASAASPHGLLTSGSARNASGRARKPSTGSGMRVCGSSTCTACPGLNGRRCLPVTATSAGYASPHQPPILTTATIPVSRAVRCAATATSDCMSWSAKAGSRQPRPTWQRQPFPLSVVAF